MLDGLLMLARPSVWMNRANLRHTLSELSSSRCHDDSLMLACSLVVRHHHMVESRFNFISAFIGVLGDVEVEVEVEVEVVKIWVT